MAMEKATLVERLALRGSEIASEVSRRKVVETDLSWVLRKRLVRIVDSIVESSECTLGIRRMKATCMAASVERGKQAALVLSPSCDFGPSELGAMARSIDGMHTAIRAVAEKHFTSYLSLGEPGLTDLCQLCSEEEDVVPDYGVEGYV